MPMYYHTSNVIANTNRNGQIFELENISITSVLMDKVFAFIWIFF